jgi:hypothetical protein
MARDRKKQNRANNVYPTSVRSKIVKQSRYDTDKLAVYGVYKDGSDWVLTAMAIQRDVEKLLSDRQGATTSEVQSRVVVAPGHNGLNPEDGLEIGTFDSKKNALKEINAESSTRVDTGEYVIKDSQWRGSIDTHKIDRDKYRDFLHSRSTQSVR